MLAKLILTIILIITLAGCTWSQEKLKSQPISTLIGAESAVIRTEEHNFKLKIADTVTEQQAGLSGMTKPPDDGLLFIFEPAARQYFWMKDMLFPIDIIWIASGKVVKVDNDVPPPRDGDSLPLVKYTTEKPVDAVIELAAGQARLFGIKKGSLVVVVKP